MLGRTKLAERSSLPGQGERLAERRRNRRRRAFIALFILLLLLLTAIVYGLQQRSVRISRVEVLGPPSLGSFGGASTDSSLASYAINAMQGSYFGIIPRDSIFFFPEMSIRSNILNDHLEIAAVSISRSGFNGISIKADYRVPVARWCGDATRLNLVADCYIFDTNGFIYATTTTAQPINSFVLYEPIDASTSPIGSTLPYAEKLPTTFDFARELATLGSPVSSIVIRDDEVDDHLESGTRITYVLGREQDAFTALVSAGESLNLSSGAIDYVDLRFDGKVYIKRH